MKKIKITNALIVSFVLTFNSCIQEDIIDDFVQPELRITNPVSQIEVGESYPFNVTFFNNIGQVEQTTITWNSSNTSIATIDQSGILIGISEGLVTITATTNSSTGIVNTNFDINVVLDGTGGPQLISKTGTIMTTSSYVLAGTFTLSEQENSTDLLLSINEDYVADTALPGLYLYLTNNPSSVANALNLGAVGVFNGGHQYIIPDTVINDYSHLLYWCEPFSIKVGDGEIQD